MTHETPNPRPPKLLVAGGGTGGHVLAGIAVADSWKRQFGSEAEVIFVGARGGIEEKLVPRAGYPLELLRIGSLNGVSFAKKLKTLSRLPLAFLRSLRILIEKRPQAVLGVGGYSSGPVVLIARALGFLGLRMRTAILEQNSVPGMTNRILGRLVDRVFCAFPGMERHFPAGRILLTGNPVRGEMKPLAPAKRDPFTVFIFGGSQGATGINHLVLDSLASLRDRLPKLRFVHQTGEKDYMRVLEGYRNAGLQTGADAQARVEKFIYDMSAVYAQASLVVCRAGSSTLAEIAAVGRASVLIPFPFASDNHQEVNARVFSDQGFAFLLIQKSAKGTDLARIIRDGMDNLPRVERMEREVAQFYKPDAAADLVRDLESRI